MRYNIHADLVVLGHRPAFGLRQADCGPVLRLGRTGRPVSLGIFSGMNPRILLANRFEIGGSVTQRYCEPYRFLQD